MKLFAGIILTILMLFSASHLVAQEEEYDNADLVQFSGVILTSDSLQPIPLAHIVVTNSMRGTVSDFNGYFSFVAKKMDTIQFTAIGYKVDTYVVPDTISDNRYSLIQLMSTDTIYLTETVIYPWPTKEQFKEAFLMLEIPEDDLAIARKNLNANQMRARAEKLPAEGSVSFKYLVHQQVDKLYYNGQTQPITILNPFAWAKFIKAWQDGDFKRKEPIDINP